MPWQTKEQKEERCVIPYAVLSFSSITNNEEIITGVLVSVSLYSNINQNVTGINNCYNYRLPKCAGAVVNSNIADILG